jgi:hypothetical protein
MADNAVLASLMARPQATENYVSVADAMRNRAMLPYQEAQTQAQTQATQAQIPIQQQQAQQLELENRQRQIQLQDQQHQMEYWSNPEKYEEEAPAAPNDGVAKLQTASLGSAMTGTPIPTGSPATAAPAKVNFAEQMLGLDSSDPLAKQANGMIRAGVMPQSVTANAQALLGFRTAVLKQTADKQAVVKDGLAEINKILAPIGAEQDTAKRAAMLQAAESELQKASTFDPSLHQAIVQADPLHVDKILNLTGGMQDVLEYGTKQAQQLAEKQKTAVPDTNDRRLANQTIMTYDVLPAAMRQGFQAEINNAPTIAAMEKIQARADEAYKSEQLKQASMAQARAMMGNKFGETGLTANEKIWSDPQHGFAGALAQAKQTKAAIVAGADGNGLMTSMVPTMEVLGINHAAGISRISPQEAQAAGAPGGWAERWNAWANKAAAGKLSPELAKEGQQLMDVVLDAAHKKALASSQLIAQGHGLTPEQTPAMDKDGNVTTLDKVMGATKPKAAPISIKAPNGRTYNFPDQKSADNFKKAAGIK